MRFLLTTCALALTLSAQTPADDKRLLFSTYQGGNKFDDAAAVAVDASGNIYVTGESESTDLKATVLGGKPLTAAVFKGYLTKYAPGGKEILWRLLIGGSSNTVPRAIALDKDGNVYITGVTGARDLPLKNAVQTTQPGLNIAFVMKFNPAGELQFSTYLGGERNDEPLAIAVDSQGNIYIAGKTTSTKWPVKNALEPQMSGGGQDAFIAKFTPDYKLAYSTYFGGVGHTDVINAIAIGPDDSLYVTGETMSPGMATEKAWNKTAYSYSSFVSRLTPEGDAVKYATYIGWKGGYTTATAIAVDASGRVYVGGNTTSKQVATTDNALQKSYAGGLRDAFLVRLSEDFSTADYVSYLGGSSSGPADPDESITALAIDAHGFVHMAGHTNSKDFPGKRALQADQAGSFDAFVLRLDLENQDVISATFWGGTKKDENVSLALGPGEAVTIAGNSASSDLPVLNAVQSKPGNADEAFVTQYCDPWPHAWWSADSAKAFAFVIGGERPAALELEVRTGCPQSFAITSPESDQAWLTVTADGGTAPAKLRLEVNVEGLVAGEYRAVVKVTVPDAYHPTLEIPITLVVADPPPPTDSAARKH
jgi:hypothetical protein